MKEVTNLHPKKNRRTRPEPKETRQDQRDFIELFLYPESFHAPQGSFIEFLLHPELFNKSDNGSNNPNGRGAA
jgi:hypothetical protein